MLGFRALLLQLTALALQLPGVPAKTQAVAAFYFILLQNAENLNTQPLGTGHSPSGVLWPP